MNRRTFLASAALTSAGMLLDTRSSLALSAPLSSDPLNRVDIYSRHLQWLRTADEVAQATLEMGYTGVNITVRPYPGHIEPAKVKTDLPPFVNTLRKHGLEVRAVTCPITDATSPNAEAILGTLQELGIHNYWWGTFHYDDKHPVMAQLDALKPRVAGLAKLNEKYGTKATYHLYAGSVDVGGPLWDLLYVLRDFDPKYVGFDYDICHMAQAGDLGTWRTSLRAAAPYVHTVSLKDALTVRLPDGRWSVDYRPLGKGLVDMPEFIKILREIKFNGPIDMQPEYENGGAQDAADKLTWPRKRVLDNMANDLKAWRAAVAGPAPTRDNYLPDGVPFVNKPFAQAGGNPPAPKK
jgi:sugar phosphate isomerase/epimerase